MSNRAATPLDPLEYQGEHVDLPQPKFKIGDVVMLDPKQHKSNFNFFVKQALRQNIRDTRKIVDRLQRMGYMEGMRGKKMLPGNKDTIRAKMDMMLKADTMEVAGLFPRGMHVTGTIGNQCYLRNGQCHGGVGYDVFLLFRRVVNGNKCVYIHPHAVVPEQCLMLV